MGGSLVNHSHVRRFALDVWIEGFGYFKAILKGLVRSNMGNSVLC